MKQTGIVDRFEGDTVVVEIGGKPMNFPSAGATSMLAEGMVVVVRDGRIAEIDQIETQRLEDDMRRRFERIIGKQIDE